MITAMHNAGLDPGTVEPDGKLHRFDVPGDRPKSGNGWYVLYSDSDIQAGRFGSWKTGESISWCSKSKTEFSPEEKKAYAAKIEAARRQRDAEQAKVHAECRDACKAIWAQGTPASNDHPYLIKKSVSAYGLKSSGDLLLVPVKSLDGTVHGIQFISNDGTKKFKTGTAKNGHFHLIGKPVDNTMIICEGYATGASIHQATGHAVLVSFDAGNLKPVAESIHKQRPALTLIITGDNDQWTEGNPGISKGQDAARAVKAEFVYPIFSNLDSKPTDFNDLYNLDGTDAVRRQVFPPPIAEYQPPGEEYEPIDIPTDGAPEFRDHPLQNAPFVCLGYNHGEYFYLPKGAPQVKALTADKHSASHLVSMAPLQWWESNFAAKTGFDSNAAANMLYRTNEQIGVYDNRRIRGRGAWEDKGRVVLHLGDALIVNGAKTPLSQHTSHWIYEAGSPLELDGTDSKPMPNADAHKLLELCKMFSWEKPIYAELLAGWMVIAPICGTLPWRPHILVTGAAGSGKSTVSDTVVRPLVGPSAITCMGNTTEAGLRGEAGSDARAVLFDEAEAGGESSRRMQAVIELARQSSSDIGYSILKGSQSGKSVKYQPRLCFCFSSIGAAATQQADNDRITTLSLIKDERHGHVERYDSIKSTIVDLITPDYCQALRARTYSLIPIILANTKIISRILAVKFGSQRTGDQYGALLAGAYSVRSRNLIDEATATAWIDTLDWSENMQDSAGRDESQCLGVILQHQIRTETNITYTIGEMLETASLNMNTNFEAARATLLRNGIRVTDTLDGFYIANKHTALEKILEKSPWSKNWGHILARVHGAIKTKPINFTAGAYSRAVLLPMTILNTGGADND